MNKKLFFLVLLFLLLVAGSFSLLAGQYDLTARDLASYLLSGELDDAKKAVLEYIRLPRTIVAILVGAGLSVAGCVIQGVFSNPIADSSIIGVSSGAALGAVIAITVGVIPHLLPFFAFIGAIIALFLTIRISTYNGRYDILALLLSGVVVSMLLSAITTIILTVIDASKIQQYIFWTVGSLDYRTYDHVLIGTPPILLGIALLILLARHLNILSLGEEEARAVGMPVTKYRLLFLGLAAIASASSVAISGGIGFVGLIIPHILRMLIGPNHEALLPACAIGGAAFLLLADSVGRVLIPNTEIHAGIMTALIGTPYFLYLIRKVVNGR